MVSPLALLAPLAAAASLAGASAAAAPPPLWPGAGAWPDPAPEAMPRVAWRDSCSLGAHTAGRLVRGVTLPREGVDFFTWDPVHDRTPNRAWRRVGNDRTVRTLLRVAAAHRRANPGAPRVAVGDISRPHGGDFGLRFGHVGHHSHQNGLDVDVYYPRRDGREEAPTAVPQIDLPLAQDLVDRFLAAGAEVVFVGPRVRVTGPRGRVVPLVSHDDHLHVRLRRTPGGCG